MVRPVPPFPVFNVPARVIAPVPGAEGVNPVVPALNDVTALLESAPHAGSPAATERIWPDVPIPNMAVVPDAD